MGEISYLLNSSLGISLRRQEGRLQGEYVPGTGRFSVNGQNHHERGDTSFKYNGPGDETALGSCLSAGE